MVHSRKALADATIAERKVSAELQECADLLAEKEDSFAVLRNANEELRSKRRKTQEDKDIVSQWLKDKAEAKTEIDIIKAEKKRLTDDIHKKAKALKAKASKSLNDAIKKKEYGAMTQSRRQYIEQELEKEFQVVRSSYHGGDLEGNQCRQFARVADEAIDHIKKLLEDIPVGERKAKDEEIDHFSNGVKVLLQCMDYMMHYCYHEYGTLTDQQLSEAERINQVFQEMWRKLCKSVPPKTHSWYHLLDNLKMLRGMKYHNESPCEVEHQIGKGMEQRFSMRDVEKSIHSILQARANQRLPEVQTQKEEVDQKSKRKLTKEKPKKSATVRRDIKDLESDVDKYQTKLSSVQELDVTEREVMLVMKDMVDQVVDRNLVKELVELS